MPLHLHKKWPHSYGFEIYGNGPCYVTLVEKGSIAHKAGLLPGDQLLGVNGQDVSNMSAGKIKVLGKSAPNQPPELEVVSCLKTHVIKPGYPLGYGFKVANKRPVIVESVDYNGPAHHSGLRVGDIILEVSSPKTASADTLAAVLSQQPGKLTIQTIPVARTGNMVQVDKGLSRIKAPDSRLYKAKDIHKKLENLMGNDHIRKMAVVGALKQYAEDRDITVFCKALGDVLTTQAHRKILTQIRQLIPPAQRAQFDDLINFSRNVETSLKTYQTRTAHNVGRKKLIRVQREADSFGFVIKSSSPAYIESVDQGGAAEKAGLQSGDYLVKLNGIDIRKCDHERLVQLIQDSGSSPTFEILRCAESGSIKSVMSSSSSSSSSSHSSVNSVLFNNTVTDKEGNTFIEKANFLLTAQEWKNMKKAIKTYEIDSDITELYSSVSALLDTPTKRTLWPFLFVILSSSHREYVSHHVKESFEDQLDAINIDGSHHSHDIVGEKLRRWDLDMNDFPPSFKQQIDFLLTSRERLQLRHSLKEYNSNHDLNTLVSTLESILDTPSKKILWRMVLTQLTDDDRETLKESAAVLNNWKTSPTLVSSAGMDSYIGSPVDNVDTAKNTEADILYGRSKPQLSRDSDSSSDERESTDSSNSPSLARDRIEIKYKSSHTGSVIAKEHEETTKTVQYTQHVMEAQDKYAAADDKSVEESQDGFSDRHYVTIIPVGYPGLEKKLPFYNQHMTSPQLSDLRKTAFNSSRNVKTYKGADVTLPDKQHDLSSSSDDDSDKGVEVVYDLTDSKYTRRAFNAQSAAELSTESAVFRTSQANSLFASVISDHLDSNNSDHVVRGSSSRKEYKKSHFMPPTPPPLPPALTLSTSELGMHESSNKMSVKRINWEKLDNKSVQNTIWEKLTDQDFSDMIHYLELETRFSTKPTPHKDYEARKEVHIMDKKKAYNISILLGHLKMSVTDMKQALYDMNENTLSADLLGQLLAFVPSEQEVSQYRLYTGELSLLTKPDQFAYQMSLVDNYEGRLKALWLKAIFKEKVEDIKKNLHDIKIASLELRNSKKLAQLLEVILAMGNYMNRGNARVGEAAGFRITFLTQLDVTKTADKKSSFLHVLADAAYNRFPEVLTLSSELATVEKAARVSIQALMQDIQSLQKSIEGTSAVLERISNQAQGLHPGDRFQEVISQFLVGASAELENILTLQASSVNEFSKTVTFFGEDPKILTSQDVFGIFSEFIKNLEKAHRHNLLFG